ncbi:hypothetical protein RB199_27245 [Streptomyces libani]|uniref:ESX-1 secretion-associated protein n=2 Tax=Streptomyces nigrescens TaxID=1920 RepID=A0A640TKB0_STRNI|nr:MULTISPECIES: hypothetical protein [Streptomyces]MCX5444540.1 hypothetical protein [Streptomyces libani]MYX07805.1 hypothetical protein [Streptomyces sp. SID8375]WAT98065.1 hypothetical protein STRLI_004074 [Streptomyces libani subsp. libani]WAU06028.1 hypothetical protein STRNI_004474 [Streptomyces nigrescens]WDT56184.1 hypothetical protein NUT86_20155 [Streptomyces sp. G7(2002)]
MGRISVPVQDLKDTANELQRIGELIGNSATLYHATGEAGSFKSVVGDSRLAEALDDFDKAWVAGHERVHDNVKVFAENTDKISENFTKTDEDSAKSLDESKKNA